ITGAGPVAARSCRGVDRSDHHFRKTASAHLLAASIDLSRANLDVPGDTRDAELRWAPLPGELCRATAQARSHEISKLRLAARTFGSADRRDPCHSGSNANAT